MKKWICTILTLSLFISVISLDTYALAEDDTKEKSMNVMAAGVESAAVETAQPTSTPNLPPYTGTIVVDSENVFTVYVNTDVRTCTITGYTGNPMATTIVIPERINENEVIVVSDKVFAGCPYLKNLVVRGSVAFTGLDLFHPAAQVEIWGVSGTKTEEFATSTARAFHPLNGPGAVTVKKAASLTKATITCIAVEGAVSYELHRKQGKGGLYSRVATSTTPSFTNDKLKAGVKYTYKVYPVFMAADQTLIRGETAKQAAVTMVPAKPKKVKAKGVRGGIQVRWNRNKNVSGYQVFMKVHVKGFKTKFNRVKTIKKNKITGYRCKMLVRGMKYSFRVRTFKKVKGKKIFSTFVTVTTKAK